MNAPRLLPTVALAIALAAGLWLLLGSGGGAPVPEPPPAERMTPDAPPRLEGLDLALGPDANVEDELGPPEGDTKLQRRFATGTQLRLTYEQLLARVISPAVAGARLSERTGFLLHADDARRAYDRIFASELTTTTNVRIRLFLRNLTVPRRDLEALSLQTPTTNTDRLGRGARVRIWTPDDSVPDGAAGDALGMIEKLDEVAEPPAHPGFDVVASREMGRDVFPYPDLPRPASGFYLGSDDCSFVSTAGSTARTLRVIRHELVHAYWFEILEMSAPIALVEGAAEYLSHLSATDRGFDIPPARLRHELAALVTMVENLSDAGWSLQQLSLGRLMALPPSSFYELGWFGYGMMLAGLAHLDHRILEDAVARRDVAALAAALSETSWEELLQFIETHAGGGELSEAILLSDSAIGWQSEGSQNASDVFRYVGARPDRRARSKDVGSLLRLSPSDVRSSSRLAAFAAGLAEGDRLVFAFGRGAFNDQLLTTTDVPPGLAEIVHVTVGTPVPRATFVRDVTYSLERAFTGPKVQQVMMTDPVREGAPATADAFAVRGLAPWLTTSKQRTHVVLFVTERDLTVRNPDAEGRITTFAELMPFPPSVSSALVIDLSPSASDAGDIAEALNRAIGERAAVALWDPTRTHDAR